MNKTIKIEIKNKQGKMIIKEIPQSMLPMYLGIGWKKVEEKTSYQPKPRSLENND